VKPLERQHQHHARVDEENQDAHLREVPRRERAVIPRHDVVQMREEN
jgi:hypothetical protein